MWDFDGHVDVLNQTVLNQTVLNRTVLNRTVLNRTVRGRTFLGGPLSARKVAEEFGSQLGEPLL